MEKAINLHTCMTVSCLFSLSHTLLPAVWLMTVFVITLQKIQAFTRANDDQHQW